MKKRLAFLLAVVMLLTVLSACGESGGSGDALQISYWIPVGEDSTYYLSYEDNPAVKYLETREYNGRKIDLSFVVPISGSELDNFNTLLMTDEYTTIMDMSFSNTTPAELYLDGYIYDLTPYVEEYMPNYMKVLEDNPQLEPYVYTLVDGEKMMLSLYAITYDILGNFKGFLYRRDWVAKYGANPETGAAFTYGYEDPNDPDTYYDDVVFPSGGSEPVYISDWEWMFEIFEKAMDDLGITDGYCTSLYYKGYSEDGTLSNAFGGGAPMWYKQPDGTIAFGGADETMRTYLQCMNTWYEKGWLDPAFAEHTGDMAYAIDSAKVHMGKVGLWVGRRSETGAQMDTGEDYTDGIMVYGARAPINDVYGTEEVQDKTPYSLYQYSQLRGSAVISNQVSEEDLPTVLSFLDYLYTAEGGALICLGLTKEQYDVTQDESYQKFGLENGAYHVEEQEDGSLKYVREDELLSDNNLASAMAGKRMTIGSYAPGFVDALNESYNIYARNAMAEWDYYLNTGYIDKAVMDQFTPEESSTFSKVYANVDTYMSTNVPQFIKGQLDIDSDEDWEDYCTMLGKYSPEDVTAIYQRVFDSMK